MSIDFNSVKTPSYIVDEELLEKNLKILDDVQKRTGCRILLALKAFSMYSEFPLIGKYLYGVTSSSLNEAKLGYEEMGKEVHIFAPAYLENEFEEITGYCDHIVFNSFSQWNKYKNLASEKGISCGMRINPEYSEIKTPLYDPCYKNSRLGVTLENFDAENIQGLDGLHFHTMCEQNSDTLKRTLKVVDEKFGEYIKKMKWINFGGGHHITRKDYDIETLVDSINFIKNKYDVQIYIEPGEAIALNTGYLVSTVLDVIDKEIPVAIMDASAACHMPDVLEMPYRPQIRGAGNPGEKEFTYRLAGNTCLAGDIIGDYSFDKKLRTGDKIILCDMAIYTMVKNNTFNGINLPSIARYNEKEGVVTVKEFGYEDFKRRL